ncbi:unnamed protein product [Adineta steineri]|uniref:HTH psq-type domain-containing protein n=1 Tax=Adineta steineri TaxID=433720 RepID=A0A814MZH2_9BILA|nr:unnamed protein product [Adineta steineri]
MASTSGKRCTLSIEQKLEILEALKSKKAEDVAKDFNIGYSTLKKIRLKIPEEQVYVNETEILLEKSSSPLNISSSSVSLTLEHSTKSKEDN